MYVQIGAAPENDFDNPLGLMSDCHRRIEGFLAALLRVSREAGDHSLEPAYREALARSLRYFREAAPQHTLDEECSLFPRLRQTRCGRRALSRVERLEVEHTRAESWHAQVERLGQRWLGDGRLPGSERQELVAVLEDLRELYERHIRVEDEELFPLAARLLSSEQLRDIGHEMAQRRGITS